MTVTLRLAGLGGESFTTASAPARFETTELHARVVEVEATPIHSQGASRVLPALGIVIASFPMESPAHTITAQSYCSREDLGLGLEVPDAPDEVAYLPGCPTVVGDRSAAFVASSPGPIYQRLDVTAGPAGAGRYGLGYWYAGPSAIDARIPGAAGWLALD